jgi:uncharacterized protein
MMPACPLIAVGRMRRPEPSAEADPVRDYSLDEKAAYLGRPGTYDHGIGDVVRLETHMSLVFLAGDRVYKLKKPVRFPYLDFSTLDRRERACRAEFRLNRRLAPDVYIGVSPLRTTSAGFSIGGEGKTVDWLVVMRRLDQRFMLDWLILHHQLTTAQIDRLAGVLVDFYRRRPPMRGSHSGFLAGWRSALSENRAILFNPRFGLEAGPLRHMDRVLRRFVEEEGDILLSRLRAGRIVDGHGDLRPEHIWLGHRLAVIDCLEFNDRLRAVDPFDEIAYLSVECERLGAATVGRALEKHLARRLRDGPTDGLFAFYRCYRAQLKARLSLAHLLEPQPRTPEKWLPLARLYLAIAYREALILERWLKSPTGRPARGGCAAGGWSRQKAGPWAAHRSSRAQIRFQFGTKGRCHTLRTGR